MAVPGRSSTSSIWWTPRETRRRNLPAKHGWAHGSSLPRTIGTGSFFTTDSSNPTRSTTRQRGGGGPDIAREHEASIAPAVRNAAPGFRRELAGTAGGPQGGPHPDRRSIPACRRHREPSVARLEPGSVCRPSGHTRNRVPHPPPAALGRLHPDRRGHAAREQGVVPPAEAPDQLPGH